MIFDLPNLPKSKEYVDKMTPEQIAVDKCTKKAPLTDADKAALKESIVFYKDVFPKLQSIDLNTISSDEVIELRAYLDKVFNVEVMVFNDVQFDLLYRVTIVAEDFREKGKVRDTKYLKYPPLDIVVKKGVYNRANSHEKTVFYASFFENVALRETKPKVGEQIIISTWKNITGKPFNSYPITNSNVDNKGAKIATEAFKRTKEQNDNLFWELTNQILGFLASEFVKDCEILNDNRYEYLYSSYFADKVLAPFNEEDPTPNYDFVIYPSVAWQHKHDNVAIIPDSVNNKLKPIKAVEYIVEETFYEKDLKEDDMPVKIKNDKRFILD
jgi:hypothetical protein